LTICSPDPGRRTLLLSRRDVATLLDLGDCIAAVEEALRLQAEGLAWPSGVLGVPAADGGFHIKTGGLQRGGAWFAVKCNGNFHQNASRFGMPRIQGLIILCDGDNGFPLAVLDSIEVTILRTGAATAVAARHLARSDARTASIFGCGNQGRVQLRALTRVLPLERVLAFDADGAAAVTFAREMEHELGLDVEAATDIPAAAGASDVCVTCTPAPRYFLRREDVRPGTFVAAVGADSGSKQEIDPLLFAGARVVVDSLEQCASIGDLHHALDAGAITLSGVHAELAAVVAGKRPGRLSPEEITLFDSTGIALEDVAACLVVYQRALERGAGVPVDFGG
jgi:ornithine cyclodeaminase/alanine dehydrogenase-like protein (mu-crystallin family)